MSERFSILLAEDDETDVLLFRRAFKDAALDNSIFVARDGQEAIDFLSKKRSPPHDHLPRLIILDLKMPRRNALEVLEWMRDQPVVCCIPAIIFSSSSHPQDVERAYAMGANAFIVKPPSVLERAEIARFIKQWLALTQPALGSAEGFQAAEMVHSALDLRQPPAD